MCCAMSWCVVSCRRYLYDMTSKWLKTGGDYGVDKIYMWNAGVRACDVMWV